MYKISTAAVFYVLIPAVPPCVPAHSCSNPLTYTMIDVYFLSSQQCNEKQSSAIDFAESSAARLSCATVGWGVENLHSVFAESQQIKAYSRPQEASCHNSVQMTPVSLGQNHVHDSHSAGTSFSSQDADSKQRLTIWF